MPVFKRWLETGESAAYVVQITATAQEEPKHVVLMLMDEPEPWDDEEDGPQPAEGEIVEVLSERRRATFDNVISYALANEDERPRSVGIVVAAPNTATRESSVQIEVLRLLKDIEPDVVLVAGFAVAKALFGHEYPKHYGYLREYNFTARDRRGTVQSYRCEASFTVPVFGWTDPNPPVKGDDGGGYVNLLGQTINHTQAAIRGRNRHTIYIPAPDHLEITTIDSLKKFDRFFERLCATDTPCLDYETEGLGKVVNRILTQHWLLPTDDEDGWYELYCLPWQHSESPWLPAEIRYMRDKLRWYFETAKSKYIVYHGGKFDVTQTINQLGVRWMNHRIYDTASGEYVLDENRKFLVQVGFKKPDGPFALSSLEREYGYRRPPEILDKSERGSMADQPLEKIVVYGTIDVVTTYQIHLKQLAEAKRRDYPNYLRIVADQLSMTTHMFSFMEARGIAADGAYLQEMSMPTSLVSTTISNALLDFKTSPAAIALNDEQLKGKSFQAQGLFGTVEKPWVFDISKRAVQADLFFNKLRLEPLGYGTSGEPQVDKFFQEKYKAVPEVEIFNRWKKMSTIKNTFIDGLQTRLVNESDAIVDGRIRPRFSFLGVLTGRSSSSDPNSQNQPSQGPLAKLVKRVWISPLGKVLLKADYRAHEVRGLGNVSGDPTIQRTFATADEAVLRLRLAGADDMADALKFFKENSDVHILNVRFFYGQIVDKKHPLRYAIKAVVFGVIYGKGAFSLGVELKEGKEKEIKEFEKQLKELEAQASPETAAQLAAVRALCEEARASWARDGKAWKDDAQAVIDKLFVTWKQGGEWIKETHRNGRENMVVFNQIGTPRHLWAYLHASRSVKGAMDRRGPNSIIQGFSSNTGYCAGYQIEREIWHTFTKHNIDIGMMQVNTVHDSLTNECNFAAIPIGLYLIEHGMTSLTMGHYHKTYGTTFPVPFGIDMDLGVHEADMFEWGDQRFDTLAQHVVKVHAAAMTRQTELLAPYGGQLPPRNVSAAAETSGRLLTEGDLKNALHNLDKIAAIRTKELRTDPRQMLLQRNTDWYEKHCVGL